MKQKFLSYNAITFLSFAMILIASMSIYSSAQNQDKQNIFQDTDGDGLSNGEERSLGTDPNVADTDGDSYSDGVEIESGYDPLIPAPGDRLIPAGTNQPTKQEAVDGRGGLESQLTNQFSGVIQEYVTSASSSGEEFLNQADLDAEVSAFMDQKIDAIEVPSIDESRINIKEQNYEDLNSQEVKNRTATDTINYATAFIYIFENGFPENFFEDDDKLLEEVYAKAEAIASGASSKQYFRETNQDIKTVLEQLYDLATPESMLDLHIEIIQTLTFIDESTAKLSELSAQDESLTFFVELLSLQEAVDSLQNMSTKWGERLASLGITSEDLGLDAEPLDESIQDDSLGQDPRDQSQLVQDQLKEEQGSEDSTVTSPDQEDDLQEDSQ